jgi:hypothetical protein
MNTVCEETKEDTRLGAECACRVALQFGSVFSTLCVDGFVISSRLFVQLISYGRFLLHHVV